LLSVRKKRKKQTTKKIDKMDTLTEVDLELTKLHDRRKANRSGDKKAMLSQGNRAMPQLFYSV